MFVFNISPNDVAPVFPIMFPVDLMRTEKNGLLTDVICVLFLLCSQLRSSPASVVFDFNVSLNDVAPLSPILFPVDLMSMGKSVLLMDAICVLFLLSSPLRLSPASVVFDFNASLIDAAPLSPILLSVDLVKMEKSGLLMDVICVLFLLCSLHRMSFVSVVFDFNASPNDVAPVSPICFPVFITK